MQLVMNIFWVCAALLSQAGAVALDGTGSLRRSAQPGAIVDGISASVATQKKGKPQRLMDAISKFRAEICFKMKVEHEKKFASFEACDKFMSEACRPGRDKKMDGDRKEVSSGSGFCEEYFPQAEKKAKEQIDKEDEDERKGKGGSPAPGPGVGSGPAPAPAPKAKAPAPAPASSAPAPAPAGAPGPSAPVPAPFYPGKTAGKPHGTIDDDESWYYKKGGKSPERLHMNADMKLPTQGYWGKLVEHEDQKTVTGDWGEEFGPNADKSFAAICAKHPNNPWCEEQGYHGGRNWRDHLRWRSSCPAVAAHLLPFVFALAVLRGL